MREQQTMREKFDAWYKSPRGESQFDLGMHYLGWAYVCYAEGYAQAAKDLAGAVESAKEADPLLPQERVND